LRPSATTDRGDQALRQGIASLNRERERLLSSFAVVNGHFQRLFTSLFAAATRIAVDRKRRPARSRLDILASRRKKPATLSLLSGGEQALTALALIFACFSPTRADLRARRGRRTARRSNVDASATCSTR